MDADNTYSTGDWIVHTHYGVGQIKRIEVKPIHDVDTKCFKVKTTDSTYWFPMTSDDNPRIRPVASQVIIDEVIENLRRKASTQDTDRKYWKEKIEEVQAESDLLSISNLVRDLHTQQSLRELNQTEKDALKHFTDRLLREWASITHDEIDQIQVLFHTYIQESMSKITVE